MRCGAALMCIDVFKMQIHNYKPANISVFHAILCHNNRVIFIKLEKKNNNNKKATSSCADTGRYDYYTFKQYQKLYCIGLWRFRNCMLSVSMALACVYFYK